MPKEGDFVRYCFISVFMCCKIFLLSYRKSSCQYFLTTERSRGLLEIVDDSFQGANGFSAV